MITLAYVLLTIPPAEWPISVPLTYLILGECVAETITLYGLLTWQVVRMWRRG